MASVTFLRAFHMVATAGGYSQAARDIGVSQSTLSGQVRQLEALAGFSLFERCPQGVRMTPDGEALYSHSSRVFAALAEVDQFLTSHKIKGGRLRIAADGTAYTVPILKTLREHRPKVTFSIRVQNSQSVIEQILQHRVDVGISANRPDDSRLHCQLLASANVGVFLLADHPWAGRKSLRLAELADKPFVLREKGSYTRAVFERNLAEQNIALGEVIEVSSREGVCDAVAAGFGLGVVAEPEFGHDQRLRFLPLEDAPHMLSEYIICLDERRRTPMVADFLRAGAEVKHTLSAAVVDSPVHA